MAAAALAAARTVPDDDRLLLVMCRFGREVGACLAFLVFWRRHFFVIFAVSRGNFDV